jgi:hypothetical protein
MNDMIQDIDAVNVLYIGVDVVNVVDVHRFGTFFTCSGRGPVVISLSSSSYPWDT